MQGQQGPFCCSTTRCNTQLWLAACTCKQVWSVFKGMQNCFSMQFKLPQGCMCCLVALLLLLLLTMRCICWWTVQAKQQQAQNCASTSSTQLMQSACSS